MKLRQVQKHTVTHEEVIRGGFMDSVSRLSLFSWIDVQTSCREQTGTLLLGFKSIHKFVKLRLCPR